ncbi:MAG: Gfo/Idh/MocA family protein [Thermoguttaceae bacterium]
MRTSRRDFLAATAATILSSTCRAAGPNEAVRVALLGAGWRGGQLIPQLAGIPAVRIVSVCDPDSRRAAEQAGQVGKLTGIASARVETDLRRVIDNDAVDAVISATPNHWHALAAIWACEAGKHVYSEKPLAHSLWESRQMVAAATKYDRIAQCGTHRRSFPNIRAIMERIRAGEFGRVVRARVVTRKFRESIGKRPAPMPIPAEVDYNLWAGPAPMTPVYRNELHYDWHWMWETGNGELANNGSHMLDLARWALGEETLAPAVTALGGRFAWDDAGETPNALIAYYDYRPAPLIAEVYNLAEKPGARTAGEYEGLQHGAVIECEEATVLCANHVEVRDRAGKTVERHVEKEGSLHTANFIDAVRGGSAEKLTCPLSTGHTTCGLALQGNISYLLGSPGEQRLDEALRQSDPETRDTVDRMLGHLDDLGLKSSRSQMIVGPTLAFDPQSERFTGSRADEANRLLRRPSYREPFVVKEVN